MKRRNSEIRAESATGKYGAKLLFQYREMEGKKANKRRLCEQRIVHIDAVSAKEALKLAKRKGKDAQYRFKNIYGNYIYFDFIGVQELLSIGVECEPDEVWYELLDLVNPMERKQKFIPPEKNLTAIRSE